MTAEQVIEQSGLPSGVERMGSLHARCESIAVGSSFQGVRLSDLDCSERRLRRALRDTAAARGGTILLDVRCAAAAESRECRAELGRSTSHPASRSSGSQRPKVRGDVRGELGYAVELDYQPRTRTESPPARAEDNVRELAVLPVSHFRLGNLEARCAGCDEISGRDALRIAAGRLGASDVVGARCLPVQAGYRCVAEIARPERMESPL